ncbi:MAG: CDP-alcohol phosphatidyltransferase family protein [Candidatus Krumholzibacteriota bacterium]|nr:CDP-alcohol phosphatidyltransferase family protein [Candidatus Krumholzibacteriota bacterium]
MESIAQLKTICRRENDRDNRKTMILASRVSIYFTRLFLLLNMSANQVTYLFILLGIGGALAFLAPGIRGVAAGYLLMRLHVIVDVSDGEVARYRQTFSAVGAYLDFLTHYFVYSLVLFAIPARYYLDQGHRWSIIAAFILILANTMNRAAVDCWFRANFGKGGRAEIEEGTGGQKRSGLPGKFRKLILLLAHTTSLQTFLNAYLLAALAEEFYPLDTRSYLIGAYALVLFVFSLVRIGLTISRGKIPRRATYYS